MNRTTATCIAGIRSKTTSRSRIHFQRRLDFRFFAFELGIGHETAGETRVQPVVFRVVRVQRIRHGHDVVLSATISQTSTICASTHGALFVCQYIAENRLLQFL